MDLDMASFGRAIASARKAKEWSQKELATKIIKEDGQPITPQYLNDIEHDRRSPSSDILIRQFAQVLQVEESALYAISGMIPQKERKLIHQATPTQIDQAFIAFRRKLRE